MRMRPLVLCSLLAATLFLGGCDSFKILKPPNATSPAVSNPVAVDITWNDSGMTSIHFTLDGADKTSAFAFTNTSTGGEATATFMLPPGSHTVAASGNYKFIYTQTATATSTFNVIGPFLSVSPSPNPLTVPSGGSAQLTINVTRGGGFTGPVNVTLSGNPPPNTSLPAGVTFSPLTIPGSSNSGQTTVSAAANATPGSNSLSVNGSDSSGSLTNQAPLQLMVTRTPGPFTEITSSIENQTSSRMCATGAVKLNICTGTNCSVPTQPFTATFDRTAGNAQIGQPLGFHVNGTGTSGIGGAGFSLCTVGAVLDADTHTISSQAMGIVFLDLSSGRTFPPGGDYFFNYGSPSGHASYVPRIFRSPDGTILIVATASTIGPSELTAAVFDQLNPNSPPDQTCTSQNANNTFSASVTTTNQVSISLAGTSCNAITIH